jgi:oligoribonuclease
LDSIKELKYYREAVFVDLPGPESAQAKDIAAQFSPN